MSLPHGIQCRGIQCLPLRSPTLPPATHTNCYVVGHGDVLVVDPGATDPAEWARLDGWLVTRGLTVKAVVLTHHHPDHVSGAAHFVARGVPIWAHVKTEARVELPVVRRLEEGEVLSVGGVEVEVLYTPGHADGHICLLHRASATLVSGDMVASIGTILVSPTSGCMIAYLESLARLRAMNLSVLLPSHGAPLTDPEAILSHYIAHRLAREAKVVAALRATPRTLVDLVHEIYASSPAEVKAGPEGGLAGYALRAHLQKLVTEGRAAACPAAHPTGWVSTNPARL